MDRQRERERRGGGERGREDTAGSKTIRAASTYTRPSTPHRARQPPH